jgi:hypothetical protein
MAAQPTPLTQFQIPDNSIFDINGKQTYLGNSFTGSVQITIVPALTEIALFLVRNPLTSPKALFNLFRRVSCTTFGNEINFNFYFSPTITTPGTFINPVNTRPSSTNVSNALTSHAPITTAGTAEIQTINTTFQLMVNYNTTYFYITTTTALYYLWFNQAGTGTDPAPGPPGAISIQVPIATPAAIPAALTTALNGIAGTPFVAVNGGSGTLTVTNTVPGLVAPAIDGSNPTNFVFAVTQEGSGVLGTYLTTLGASLDPVTDDTLYVLDPGESLFVTGIAGNAGSVAAIEINWYEL